MKYRCLGSGLRAISLHTMGLTDQELRDVLGRAQEIQGSLRSGAEFASEMESVIVAAQEVGISRECAARLAPDAADQIAGAGLGPESSSARRQARTMSPADSIRSITPTLFPACQYSFAPVGSSEARLSCQNDLTPYQVRIQRLVRLPRSIQRASRPARRPVRRT